MKSRSALLLITLIVISLIPFSISVASPEVHHVPRLYRTTATYPLPPPAFPFFPREPFPDWSPQPFMAGYMDANGFYSGVKKTRVTVSFPDTNPSVIQADNWIAGGMFVTGYDNTLDQVDYGFYTMLTLDHTGNLYLDFGINQTYECIWKPLGAFPYGYLPWTKGIYNSTIPIEGVSPSTPITLTASWDEPSPGWMSWEYTINEVTSLADAQNVTRLVEALDPSGNIQPWFIVGYRNVGYYPFCPCGAYLQTYNFQCGVISFYNIGHGGWNVLLSNPSYFNDDEWNNVETAKSIGGSNAFLDYRWMWGGENYPGVNACYYPSLAPRNVKFYYSNSTIEDLTPLWGIPVAPADNSSAYVDPNSDSETFAIPYQDIGAYRLLVGSFYQPSSPYSYANVTLSKNFVQACTITNPTFCFRFHERGFICAQESPGSYATLNASQRLWHNGNELCRLSQPIYTIGGNCCYTDGFHEISMTYYGQLLEGNNYTIEYGFSASEHEEGYIDFLSSDYLIQAMWLIKTDNYKLTVKAHVAGFCGGEINGTNIWVDGNPISPSPVTINISSGIVHTVQVESSFNRTNPINQKTQIYTFDHWEENSTSNPRTIDMTSNKTIKAYYNWTIDLNRDSTIDIFDIVIMARAFGSTPNDPSWDPIADINNDSIIDIFDIVLVADQFGSDSVFPPESSGSSSSGMTQMLMEQTTTVISTYPSQIAVHKHETFSVDIVITNATDLYGWELQLYWNNAILNCTDAQIHLPTAWGENSFEVGVGIQNAFNETHGRYWKAMSALNPASTFNGSMAVVTLTFEAKAIGTSALTLQETKLSDIEANSITHTAEDGSVIVAPRQRYMRGDTDTVNGLNAYKLGTSQSSIAKSSSQTVGDYGLSAYWGIQVWKRNAGGTETSLTSGIVAQVSRTGQGQGIQSATWNCPLTSLNSTDIIVVRVYQKIEGGSWQLAATFTTEQLNATQLDSRTWTVYYYTKLKWIFLQHAEYTTASFYWGTTTYNSHIQNFEHN